MRLLIDDERGRDAQDVGCVSLAMMPRSSKASESSLCGRPSRPTRQADLAHEPARSHGAAIDSQTSTIRSPASSRAFRQLLGDDDVDRRPRNRRRERIAAEGAAMIARLKEVHDLPVCERSRDRVVAAAEAFPSREYRA